MKVSMRDLSKMTVFSPATISNALNHKKGVNTVAYTHLFCCIHIQQGFFGCSSKRQRSFFSAFFSMRET